MTTLCGAIVSDDKIELKNTIEYMRRLGVFDEIVVVADTDKGIDIEESASLADKYLLKSLETVEEAIDDINNMTSCDWLFRLDDDERVGIRFRDEMKYFLASVEMDAFWMPRFWLWPDKGNFLDCHPWYPDQQLRLWRKNHLKVRIWWHTAPTPVGKVSHISWHLYHLVLLTKTYEERVERCQLYARKMGIPYAEFLHGIGSFYLPELSKKELDIDRLTEEMVE